MRNFDEFIKTAGISTSLATIGTKALSTGTKFLNSSAGKKALTGAAIGAATGAVTAQPGSDGRTHRLRNAMVGATTGGLAGAAYNGIQNMGTVTPEGIKNGVSNIGSKIQGAFSTLNSNNKTAFEELDDMVKEAGIGTSLKMAGMNAKMHTQMAGLKLRMLPMQIKANHYAKKHPEQQNQQNDENKQQPAQQGEQKPEKRVIK